MKPIYLLGMAMLFYVSPARAQSLSPSVIAVDGGISKGSKITLEWTIGEIAVASIPTLKGKMTEGFHQPVLIIQSEMAASSSYAVSIKPNPARSELNLSINAEKAEEITIGLFDLQGQRIIQLKGQLPDFTHTMSLEALPAGAYLLRISRLNGQLLETHKVIKLQ